MTLVVAALVVFVAALSAVTSMPAVCSSCHAMRGHADALADSNHSAVGCYGCHLEGGLGDWPAAKVREWTIMYPAQILGRGPAGPATQISASSCLACHGGVFEETTERNGLRIEHAACAAGVASCDGCHSTVAHGAAVRWVRVPVMEECILCHQREGAPDACDTCHVGRRERERLAVGPWQVTHGAAWKQTHGLGSLQYCATCHPDDYCVQCHGIALPHPADFGRTHGATAIANPGSCETCHETDTMCEACHGLEMPHPQGFLAEHSAIAGSREDPACLSCHQSIDCIGCHEKHTHPGNTDGTLGHPPNGSIGPVEAEVR